MNSRGTLTVDSWFCFSLAGSKSFNEGSKGIRKSLSSFALLYLWMMRPHLMAWKLIDSLRASGAFQDVWIIRHQTFSKCLWSLGARRSIHLETPKSQRNPWSNELRSQFARKQILGVQVFWPWVSAICFRLQLAAWRTLWMSITLPVEVKPRYGPCPGWQISTLWFMSLVSLATLLFE